jgi:hypothetical protein
MTESQYWLLGGIGYMFVLAFLIGAIASNVKTGDKE